MQESFLTRQMEILSGNALKQKILIVGAGAIGSFTALTLAKMGFDDITVYDDDVIDPENMNCQFFRVEDIGNKKVSALKALVEDFTGTQIGVHDCKFEGDFSEYAIVISAVDCMEARKMISETANAEFLVDARMGAEYIAMYTVDMNDQGQMDNYAKSLYSNEEAVQERCTAKSTMYTVNLIAGLIGKAVKDIVTGNQPTTSLDWHVGNNGAVWFNGETKGTM